MELDDAATAVIEKMIKQRKGRHQPVPDGQPPGPGGQGTVRNSGFDRLHAPALQRRGIAALVQQAKSETGAAGAKDMGKMMAWLKPAWPAGGHDRRLRPVKAALVN